MIQYKAQRVAIITPVHNDGNFIADAFDSVQSQTYPNIVHFVLDNASTDQTSEICEKYSRRRVPVVVLRNKNFLPLCKNWNKAVEIGAAGSDYFRILCADDTMPPDSIAKMVALATSSPEVALVCCQQQTANGRETCGWDSTRSVFSGHEALRECLLGRAWFSAPHLLYRTDVTTLRTPFFDPSLMAIDTDIAFHILAAGEAFGFIHEPLGFTRFHDASITRTRLKPMHRDYYDWHVLLHRYGGEVLTPQERAERLKGFRRHYFGRLLVWRFKHGNRAAYTWHLKALAAIGNEPDALAFLDSLLHFGLRKLGLRERGYGWPEG